MDKASVSLEDLWGWRDGRRRGEVGNEDEDKVWEKLKGTEGRKTADERCLLKCRPLLEVVRSSLRDIIFCVKGEFWYFFWALHFYIQVYKRFTLTKSFSIGPVCLPQLRCNPLGQLRHLKSHAFNVPVFDRMRLLFLQRCSFFFC